MEKDGSKFIMENNILKGDEVSYQIDFTNLGQLVIEILGKNEDFVGQVDVVTGEEYTYKKIRERSVRCAIWMKSQGLLPGDVVAICSHNQLDIAMPCYAALYLGAVFHPLDETMTANELRYLMNITEPKMAFVSEESATAVAEAKKEANPDLKVIVFGRAAGFLEFESVIAEPEVDEVKSFVCAPITNPRQTAIVMCSSGTTGLPKGVALSHEAILNELFQSDKLGMSGNNCLVFSSIHWITGTLSLFTPLFSKVTRLIVLPFEEYSACEIVEKRQISWLFLGAPMIKKLLKSGALAKYNLSHVKRVHYGGAPLPLESREAFAKFVPNALITSSYGATELCGLVTMQTANSKPGSSGQIRDNSQLKVTDPCTGRTLGANERGELLWKTTSMMSFCCGNPQATAEAVDEKGWFHSGDLGYYDADVEVFVIDRVKELINYRGYLVSPIEIENVIWCHPGVKEVAVVSVPHPVDNEHPIAFVARATDPTGADEKVTETELVDLVAAKLSDSKQLRGGVRFVDRLPATQSGKPLRRILRDLAKSRSENDTPSMYPVSHSSLSSYII